MPNDDLQILREFRAEIAAPDEETRRRIYSYATQSRPMRTRSLLRYAPLGVRVAMPAVVVIAAVAIAVVAGVLGGSGAHRRTAARGPSPTGSGCASFRGRLSAVVGLGQSVVEATGLLAPHPRLVGGKPFWRMRLTEVSTLSGQRSRGSLVGWIQATPYPAPDAADAPGLWAPDGHLIAIVTPSQIAHTKLGPLLSTAPLVGGKVILSAASCWADPSLPTSTFTGPLSDVPGSNAYSLAKQAGGFAALSLPQFLKLLHP